MAERSQRESFKLDGGQMLDRVKKLIHEGNVRRIVIRQNDRVIAEFPLTFGVIGALVAPALAAVGAIAALASDCTIELERTDAVEDTGRQPVTEAPPVSAEEIVDL
jgi:hypothetical protein